MPAVFYYVTDETPGPSHDGGSTTNDLPLHSRVAVARALLEPPLGPEYESLPAGQQARVQEAVEFLRRVESGFPGGEQRE